MNINDEYGYEVSIELVCQRGTVATEQANKALIRAKAYRGYFFASGGLKPFKDAMIRRP